MKYTKEQLEAMSNLQLNRVIAFDIKDCEHDKAVKQHQDSGMCATNYSNDAVSVDENHNLVFHNYCEECSDMMPLVFEAKINLLVTHNGWMAFSEHDKPLESEHANPLRSCAIVYILINQ